MNKISAIVLAAGDGTRMNLDYPKVLCKLNGTDIISLIIGTLHSIELKDIILVVGYKHEMIREKVGGAVKYVLQKELLGTGHAVSQAESIYKEINENVLILYGDSPLITSMTLKKIIDSYLNSNSDLALLTVFIDDPTGYGRIIRDKNNKIIKIIEEKDATAEQKKIKEVNTGFYCFKKEKLFRSLKNIRSDNAQKEYYLTDVIADFVQKNYRISSVETGDPMETMGINTRADMEKAILYYKSRG